MITIFAIPKAFEGNTALIQRNAIVSWTLLRPKPPLILCEVNDSRTKPWGYRADSIIEFLEDHGYRWYGLDGDGQLIPHPEGLSGNFVAMPDSKPWLR